MQGGAVTEGAAVTGPGPVRRRRVFYIPGFDPSPPRRYRALYRSEAARQAALSGYRIEPAGTARGADWQVVGRFGADVVEVRLSVLDWSDLVRAETARGLGLTLLRMLRTARTYLRSGALVPLLGLRRGPMLAALYPVVVVLVQAAAILAAAGLSAACVLWLLPAPFAATAGGATAGGAAAAAAAGAALVLARWFRRIDGRLRAHALLHDFAFFAQAGGAHPPALEARISAFRTAVGAALEEDWDEVLLVGHSSGAQLAVSVAAGLLHDGARPHRPPRPALSLLTLGQVIPKQSFLPGAHGLRADLHRLSRSRAICWVDVTAPGDGCSFALCDPVAVTGVAGDPRRGPLVISAAFRRTLRPATLARLRGRFLRIHFQYLCAFDNLAGDPADYDYFRITAGPLTLGARFAGRAPSPARIERSTSPHRSIAA